MDDKRYPSAHDVSACSGISIPSAYRIIRRKKEVLATRGYLTFPGKEAVVSTSAEIYDGPGVCGRCD